MPRPERPLNPLDGPLQAFAADLRKLRQEAGAPKYLQMARRTGRSRTALSEAAGGDHLPTWETVEAFVEACGGDRGHWAKRYAETRAAIKGSESVSNPATASGEPATVVDAGQPDPADTDTAPRFYHSRHRFTFLATGTLIVVTVILSIANFGISAQRKTAHSGRAVIQVQNKVAIGPSALEEDSTPVYLSSKPLAFCARRGCKIARTEMWSNALVVATCYTRGERMTNADLSSPHVAKNPERADSDLWYQVTLQPNNVTGYLSEVYVVASDRGGMGLPGCRQASD